VALLTHRLERVLPEASAGAAKTPRKVVDARNKDAKNILKMNVDKD
jgi:hypothetical protein